MIRTSTFIAFFFLLTTQLTFSQKKDSVYQIKTSYWNLELKETYPDSLRSVDTSLTYFHEYNPVFLFENFAVNSGIYGSPYHSILFESAFFTGIESGIKSYDIYKSDYRKISYFDTYSPFTELFYVQGENELQKLSALHSRNITPFWNITARYFTNISSEFYGNQASLLKNKVKNLSFTTNYRSKNENYQLQASFISNKINASDNGGINDTSYSKYSLRDRYYANIFLENARISLKEKQLALNHSLKITPGSTDSVPTKQPKNALSVYHHFLYQKTDFAYTDEDLNLDYFQSTYLSTEETNDSLDHSRLKNELGFHIQSNENAFNQIRVGVRHSHDRFVHNGHDSAFTYLTALFQMNRQLGKKELKAKAEYILSGRLAGEYAAHVAVSIPIAHTFFWQNTLALKRQHVDYLYSIARGNHLQWQNQFNPVNTLMANTAIENPSHAFSTRLSYYLIDHYAYLNELIRPVQMNSTLSVLSCVIRKDFTAGHFHFNNHIAFQYSSNSEALALPIWAVNHITYFEGKAFKNNLNLQIGFNLRIADDYYADALYAPFSLYHRQEKVESAIYPLVDVFVNASIKRTKGFVKYEHVNYGFPAGEYFIVGNYPYKQRALVFGVSWMFFD
jgi:hypothetical protein